MTENKVNRLFGTKNYISAFFMGANQNNKEEQ